MWTYVCKMRYYRTYLSVCICLSIYVHVCAVHSHMSQNAWKSDNSLRESVLIFHHVDSRVGTSLVASTFTMCLYLLSHLASPGAALLKMVMKGARGIWLGGREHLQSGCSYRGLRSVPSTHKLLGIWYFTEICMQAKHQCTQNKNK